MPQGTVEVELVRGHDLKDVEAFGKSDPYAVLSCGHVTHRSRTIHDAGSNPVWNQTFLFEVPDGVTDLAVAIYDLETHGRDEVMGTALVPLANVYAQRGIAPAKYKVRLRNGRYHGEVELGLKFFPKVYHGSLELHLVQGHNLLSEDLFDKSDPYAVITCNKQTVKSNTMENAGSDPVWDQTFAFTIDSEVSEAIIKLFDRDTFSADDPLGDAKIPLQMVFVEGHIPPTNYKVFSSSGKPQGLNTGFWLKAHKSIVKVVFSTAFWLGLLCQNKEFPGMSPMHRIVLGGGCVEQGDFSPYINCLLLRVEV